MGFRQPYLHGETDTLLLRQMIIVIQKRIQRDVITEGAHIVFRQGTDELMEIAAERLFISVVIQLGKDADALPEIVPRFFCFLHIALLGQEQALLGL